MHIISPLKATIMSIFRTMLFSQTSLSTGYVPSFSVGRIHYFSK
jgi:hypothetical protein